MALDDVRMVLHERNDPNALAAHLERHARRLEERVEESRRSLAYLRQLIDQREPLTTYQVQLREEAAQGLVGIRVQTTLVRLPAVIGPAFSEIYRHLGELGVRPAGPPLSIYHHAELADDELDVEFGVPVNDEVANRDHLSYRQLVAGPVALTLHAGAYAEIGPAYVALGAWIQNHGHEPAGPARELYIVGPAQGSDPTAFRTEVAWPIR